jgi:two-component system, NarL family, response regulator DevR
MEPITLVIADDHLLVRQTLREELERLPWLRVAAETHTAQDTLQQACELQPAIVLLDAELPDGSGLAACGTIKACCPQVQMLILARDDADAYLARAWEAGAAGFVPFTASLETLIAALQQLAAGATAWTDAQLERIERWQGTVGAQLASLTPREREILRAMASGLTNREIAEDLGIAEKTVETHASNVFSKLGLASRREVAAWVAQSGALIE